MNKIVIVLVCTKCLKLITSGKCLNLITSKENMSFQQLTLAFHCLFVFSSEVLKCGIKSCFDRASFSRCSYNVMSLCCIFASQGISLCFTAVKIVKNVITDKKFLQSGFFVSFSSLKSFFLKYKFFKLGARKFHFLKCKKLFKSGFLLFFELRKVLPEIKEVF